jgi:hypothetical protein
MRGIKKDKGLYSRVKRTVTFGMSLDLTKQVKKGDLAQLRNDLIYKQLGQSIQRAQAAVSQTIIWWEYDRNLTVADVVVDMKRYAVGFALKNSKNDKFHTNADDPTDAMHRDWIWCAGCKESPLDIVPTALEYIRIMRFENLTPYQREHTPFYQQVDRNRPTGKPLLYRNLLQQFRADLKRLPVSKYPTLDPTQWGIHAWRRYGATVAKLAGLPNDSIQYLGRWKSDTFLAYFAYTTDDEIAMQSQVLTKLSRMPANVHGVEGTIRAASAAPAAQLHGHVVLGNTSRLQAVRGRPGSIPAGRLRPGNDRHQRPRFLRKPKADGLPGQKARGGSAAYVGGIDIRACEGRPGLGKPRGGLGGAGRRRALRRVARSPARPGVRYNRGVGGGKAGL